MAVEQHRLFIGGLFKGISEGELEDRFSRYGEVGSVEIISRFDENGEVYKTFGYVDLRADDSNIKKCLQTYSGSTWKGHSLTIQTAKESFLQRLKREREEEKSKEKLEKKSKKTASAKDRLRENFSKAGVKDFNIRNAVPGSEIPGEKNWTVTRFGRVVPIVYIRSKNKRKVNKIDPSKHSHAIRRLKDENGIDTDVKALTWELDAMEDEVQYKKRIGAYSDPTKKKKRKLSHHIDDNLSKDNDSKVLPNWSTGNMFYYQYVDDKEKDDDFEVVSGKFKLARQEATTQRHQGGLHCRVYDSSSDDDTEDEGPSHENVLVLPKAKNNSYLNLVSKTSNGEKGQKEQIEMFPKILPKSQQRTCEEELIERTSGNVEPVNTVSSKTISNQSNDEKRKNSSSDLLDQTEVSRSGSNSDYDDDDDNESEDSEKPDDQKVVTELNSQRTKSVATKSSEGESGYLIFGTKDPVDAEEDVLDVVNTDSSRRFYYQSAINPITNEKIDFIILEPQSKETHDLYVLQRKSLVKKFTEEKYEGGKREDEEDKKDESEDEGEKEAEEMKSMPSIFASTSHTGCNTETVSKECINSIRYKTFFDDRTQQKLDFIVLQPERASKEKNESDLPVTKYSVPNLDDQLGSGSDAVSVSSTDTDEICSRKEVIMLAGDISRRKSCALGVVEFEDEIESLTVEHGDSEAKENQGKMIKNIQLISDEGEKDKKKRKEIVDFKLLQETNTSDDGDDENVNEEEETISSSDADDENSSDEENDICEEDVTDDEELTGDKDGSSGEDVTNDEEDGSSDEDVTDDEELTGDEDGSSGEDVTNDEELTGDEDGISGEDVTNDEEDGGSDEDVTDDEELTGDQDGSSGEDVTDDEEDGGIDEDVSNDEDDNSSDEEDSTSSEDTKTPKLTSPNSVNGKDVCSSKNLNVMEPKKVLDLSVLDGNPAKQASSNIKRLESLQKKKEVMLGQKKAIQMALAAVDSKTGPAQGKRIVFDSDDEGDDGRNIVLRDETDSTELKPTNKGPSLFASDEEQSSEDEDDFARFQIKPQFEGKAGEQLRKLQEQIGGDDRFAMDKRFLEDQADEDDPNHMISNSSADQDDEDVDNEVDLKTEKEKSLSILQSIVGTKGVISRPKEMHGEKLGFMGMMIRYDPSRDDHTQYEMKSKDKRPSTIEKKSVKKGKQIVPEITLPEVSKEKYFEVSGDITKAFGSDEKTIGNIESNDDKDAVESSPQKGLTFRFFGGSDDEEGNTSTNPASDEGTLSEALPRANDFTSGGSQFRFFESSDEEMDFEEMTKKETLEMKSDIGTAEPTPKQSFFFRVDDQRLNDGPLQFYRKDSIDNITQKWQEKRTSLMTLSRNRYRKAIRQKKQTAQRMKKKF